MEKEKVYKYVLGECRGSVKAKDRDEAVQIILDDMQEDIYDALSCEDEEDNT